MDNMLLYFAPDTCARVPMIALEEAGQEFDSRVVAFKAGEHLSPQFLALNPKAKVPALVIGNRTITENVAILSYLAECFPGAQLLPVTDDPILRAGVLADLSFCSSGLHPLVTRLRLPQFFCAVPGGAQSVWDIAAAQMRTSFELIERRLQHEAWWYGDQWSVVDPYINWVWFRVTGTGFAVDAFPAYAAHARAQEARSATRRALAREAVGRQELEARGLALEFPRVDQVKKHDETARQYRETLKTADENRETK